MINSNYSFVLGAYKLHEFDMRLELGPHDIMPENFSPHAWVQYSRPNSMVRLCNDFMYISHHTILLN